MLVFLQNLGSVCVAQELCLDHFPYVIGRRRDSDGHLPFAFISRTHCQFLCADQQILVQDLESYNGTFLNGRRVRHPVPVANGDEITLGPLSFRLVIPPNWQETTEACSSPTQAEVSKLLSR
jgi:pSer/pThr/pTyr-binding forkhead associated (FHA) protein